MNFAAQELLGVLDGDAEADRFFVVEARFGQGDDHARVRDEDRSTALAGNDGQVEFERVLADAGDAAGEDGGLGAEGFDDEPSAATGRLGTSIWTSATSVLASEATTRAGTERRSSSVARNLRAPSITCSTVRICVPQAPLAIETPLP